jgi:hypothetical protein
VTIEHRLGDVMTQSLDYTLVHNAHNMVTGQQIVSVTIRPYFLTSVMDQYIADGILAI